jgi:farnesyl-diphosphate farnesyltransferase
MSTVIQPMPEAIEYQNLALQHVSRTFALTIPELPPSLQCVVANAYLLCRAADTIEDDTALSLDQKGHYGRALVEVVAGRSSADDFAAALAPLLSPECPAAERDLISHLSLIISITRSFNAVQQQAVERCVRVMWQGMYRFQCRAGVYGLDTMRDMDAYCYYVAGVVGEMLTELFCDYSPEIAQHGEAMKQLASSFGKGLQMTNILKDQRDDHERGVSWLPREVFAKYGVGLSALQPGYRTPAYAAAQQELLGIAHAHLRNGLAFTLLIPAKESGIRRFCYWGIHLAALTLRNIHRRPDFASSEEIKVPRRKVSSMISLTELVIRSNALLTRVFKRAAGPLPLSVVVLDQASGQISSSLLNRPR